MQIIKLAETTAALIEIPFTTVLATNLQSRILAATLANSSITVKIKQANVTTAVTGGAGTFTACDDTGAPGVRGYKPSSGELALGVSTFIFTGANMEPREVPVMVVADSPYAAVTAIWTYVLEGARTPRGVLRRLDALIKGKATGLVGTTAAFYADDGTTKLIEATQDTGAGTRTAASTAAGD